MVLPVINRPSSVIQSVPAEMLVTLGYGGDTAYAARGADDRRTDQFSSGELQQRTMRVVADQSEFDSTFACNRQCTVDAATWVIENVTRYPGNLRRLTLVQEFAR